MDSPRVDLCSSTVEISVWLVGGIVDDSNNHQVCVIKKLNSLCVCDKPGSRIAKMTHLVGKLEKALQKKKSRRLSKEQLTRRDFSVII